MGFAPADKPRITIGVMIDEPRIGGRNGGDVAAPVFLEIVDTVLPAMNVTPDAPGLVFDNGEELIAESVGNGETDEKQDSLMTDDRESVATKPKTDTLATEPKKEKPHRPETKPDAVSAAKPKAPDEKKKSKEIEKTGEAKKQNLKLQTAIEYMNAQSDGLEPALATREIESFVIDSRDAQRQRVFCALAAGL